VRPDRDDATVVVDRPGPSQPDVADLTVVRHGMARTPSPTIFSNNSHEWRPVPPMVRLHAAQMHPLIRIVAAPQLVGFGDRKAPAPSSNLVGVPHDQWAAAPLSR